MGGQPKRAAAAGRWGGTVSGRLRELAASHGDRTFVEPVGGATASHAGPLTYGHLDERSARAAGVLARLGVGPGDAVHLQLGNRPEFLTAFFAVARLGAVAVPTSRASTVDDLAYVTSHARCRASIVEAEGAATVLAAREMAPDIEHVLTVGQPIPSATTEWTSALEAGDPTTGVAAIDDLAPAAVLYTSGTSGWPKGVVLTHRNLLFSGEAVADHVRLRPDDRWFVALPLFHLNALGYSTMSALSTGASITLADELDTSAWIGAARATGATLLSLFAVHARRLLATAERDDDPDNALRLLMFAQHLTAGERRRLERRFELTARQVYGMTETIAPTIGDPMYGSIRPETIGVPTPWAAVRVVDRTGGEVPAGAAGELIVGGEPGRSLMAGYSQRPDETGLVLRDGWLRTGDRVARETDGSFRFLGRAVDVIKPGVDNVSALEIERVLVEHVSVADASVIGAHNAAGDETIVAFIVLHHDGDDATTDELLAWARERLADYKVPERIEVLDELPRNALGKVVKHELQRLADSG